MGYAQDILTLVSTMKARGTPFVLATVVRTVAAHPPRRRERKR